MNVEIVDALRHAPRMLALLLSLHKDYQWAVGNRRRLEVLAKITYLPSLTSSLSRASRSTSQISTPSTIYVSAATASRLSVGGIASSACNNHRQPPAFDRRSCLSQRLHSQLATVSSQRRPPPHPRREAAAHFFHHSFTTAVELDDTCCDGTLYSTAFSSKGEDKVPSQRMSSSSTTVMEER